VIAENGDAERCHISFDYESKTPLPPESTYKGSLFAKEDTSQGLYHSEAECRSWLENQREIFESATGLEAVVSYCYHEHALATIGSDSEWVLRIDGFGEAEKHAWLFEEMLESPKTVPQDITQQIARGLTEQEIPYARIMVRQGMGGIVTDLNVFYYAKKQLVFSFYPLNLPSDAICASDLTVMDDWFRRAGTVPLVSYCKWATSFSYPQLLVLRVYEKSEGVVDLKKRYRTYEKCMSARSDVMRHYAESDEWEPFGALCGVAWGGFQMTLFGPKRESR
jgi:hypothetical protein